MSLGELKTSLKLRFYRVLGGCFALISPFGGGVGGGSRGRIKSSGVMSGTYFSAPSWAAEPWRASMAKRRLCH